MKYTLPELPPAIRVLNQEESERLDSIYPNLPKSLHDCPTCAGRKTFLWYDNYGATDAKIVEYDCPCSDQFVMFKYFLHCGLGKQGQRLMLGDCQDVETSALMATSAYLEKSHYYVSRGAGLLFHGGIGTGKTLLATILFKQLLAEGIDGHFTIFNDMLDNFASGWRDDKNRAWFDKRIRNAPVLLVDDIGREHSGRNAVAISALDSVFRTRVQNGLPTIITTNLSPEEFEKAYSSNIMSLLSETSLSYHFKGADWRPNQLNKRETEINLMLSRPIVVS